MAASPSDNEKTPQRTCARVMRLALLAISGILPTVSSNDTFSAAPELQCRVGSDARNVRPAKPLTGKRIAISLARLQAGLKGQRIRAERPTPMTRISGVSRAANGDLIIFGVEERGSGVSAITPDDIIVALRTVLVSYQSPGMSIDPVKAENEGVDCHAKYREVSTRQWDSIMAACQKVDYFGGIENTRIGQVAFDVDYWMKRVAAGRQRVPLDGFCSYADLLRANDRGDADRRTQGGTRFWFYPKQVKFAISRDQKVMELQGGGVEVLTAEERNLFSKTAQGASVPQQGRSRSGEIFAKELTDRYDELTTINPQLAALRNFLALRAIFGWMESKNTIRSDWTYLLNEYRPIAAYTTPRIPTVRQEVANVGGNAVLVLEGGVSMELRFAAVPVMARDGRLESLGREIATAEVKSDEGYYWTF